jgi:hypothetical protein
VLSTDIHTGHDDNTFQLPNLTARYELIAMLHYHKVGISRLILIFLPIGSLMHPYGGARAASSGPDRQPSCAEAARGLHSFLKGQQYTWCILRTISLLLFSILIYCYIRPASIYLAPSHGRRAPLVDTWRSTASTPFWNPSMRPP